MRTALSLGAGLAMIAVSACAPATAGRALALDAARDTPYDRSVIQRAEMADAQATDAYEAIMRLRPQFFTRTGERSARRPLARLAVYLDNVRLGGVEALRSIPVSAIASIRYFSAGEAHYNWGLDNEGGAIQIRSRTRP